MLQKPLCGSLQRISKCLCFLFFTHTRYSVTHLPDSVITNLSDFQGICRNLSLSGPPENTTTDKTSISFCTLSVSNEPQNTVRHFEQYSRSVKGPAAIHRPPVNRSFSNIGFLQHLWKWGSFFYAFPNRYQYLQPFMTFLSVYHFVTSSYRTSQSFPSSSMTKSGMYTAFSRMQQVWIISLGAVFFPFR